MEKTISKSEVMCILNHYNVNSAKVVSEINKLLVYDVDDEDVISELSDIVDDLPRRYEGAWTKAHADGILLMWREYFKKRGGAGAPLPEYDKFRKEDKEIYGD